MTLVDEWSGARFSPLNGSRLPAFRVLSVSAVPLVVLVGRPARRSLVTEGCMCTHDQPLCVGAPVHVRLRGRREAAAGAQPRGMLRDVFDEDAELYDRAHPHYQVRRSAH